MASFLQKLKNYLHPDRRQFICDSEALQKTKEDVSVSEQSFLEVYKQTRELAGDIIAKLEENRKKVKVLYSAFNAASDLIIIFDGIGTIVYANTQFLGFYDYHEHELIGKNIIDICGVDKSTYNVMWNTVVKNKVWEGGLHCIDSFGNQHLKESKILPIMNGVPLPIYYVCSQSRT